VLPVIDVRETLRTRVGAGPPPRALKAGARAAPAGIVIGTVNARSKATSSKTRGATSEADSQRNAGLCLCAESAMN
jgi:hypothetical protein